MNKALLSILLTTSIFISASQKSKLPGNNIHRKSPSKQTNIHRYERGQGARYFVEQRELQRKEDAARINNYGATTSPTGSPRKKQARKN